MQLLKHNNGWADVGLRPVGTTLTMRAEGLLRRKTGDTAVKKRAISYSRSIADQDLKEIVADGYRYFADELVSHLMGLPKLPSLPPVDKPSNDDSQGHLRVALLPIKFTGTSDNSLALTSEPLAEQAKQVITGVPAFKLVESDQIQESELLIKNRVWKKLSELESSPT